VDPHGEIYNAPKIRVFTFQPLNSPKSHKNRDFPVKLTRGRVASISETRAAKGTGHDYYGVTIGRVEKTGPFSGKTPLVFGK